MREAPLLSLRGTRVLGRTISVGAFAVTIAEMHKSVAVLILAPRCATWQPDSMRGVAIE